MDLIEQLVYLLWFLVYFLLVDWEDFLLLLHVLEFDCEVVLLKLEGFYVLGDGVDAGFYGLAVGEFLLEWMLEGVYLMLFFLDVGEELDFIGVFELF